MLATDTLDGPTADLTDYRALPAPVAAVRLRGVRAFRVVNDDDEAVLMISDGETTVEFGCGLCGPTSPAVNGAQRLAAAIEEFADTLRADLDRSRPNRP